MSKLSKILPIEAIEKERVGVLGMTGSGKTYAAKGQVERLLKLGRRVVIPDVTGAWWGLRVGPSGEKKGGFPIAVLGGKHGDLPLTEYQGKVLGRAIGLGSFSCVLDLTGLGSQAARRRFMLAFLLELYEANERPLHLILDEADYWAPQRASGAAAPLLGAVDEIARRGRIKGFMPWLISQRPAVVNKDVLSQLDTLIAMKVTGSHDRRAFEDWLKGHAEPAKMRAMMTEIATFPTGTGYVWCPARDVLEKVIFPKIVTYDSSSAPTNAGRVAPELAKVDLEALKAALAEAEPKPKGQRAPKGSPSPHLLPPGIKHESLSQITKGDVERAYSAGYKAGIEDGKKDGFAKGRSEGWAAGRQEFLRELNVKIAAIQVGESRSPPPLIVDPKGFLKDNVKLEPGPIMRLPKAPVIVTYEGGPSKSERKILVALAQTLVGTAEATAKKARIAMLAGYSAGAGHFNNLLGALRGKGWITGSGELAITKLGLEALGSYDPLPTGQALHDYWIANAGGKCEGECLRVLLGAYPDSLTKDEVAERAGYSGGAGHFNNSLGRLRTLQLITGARGEPLRASDALF